MKRGTENQFHDHKEGKGTDTLCAKFQPLIEHFHVFSSLFLQGVCYVTSWLGDRNKTVHSVLVPPSHRIMCFLELLYSNFSAKHNLFKVISRWPFSS